MATFIKRRTHHTNVTFRLMFDDIGKKHCGFSFDCDENGNVDNDWAPASYQECLKTPEKFEKPYVQKFQHSYFEPAEIECVCGAHVVLHGFTNTCDHCERDYNGSGQLLADRSQWGEETGETF